MWAGIPFAPVSPAYSLLSQDYGKLRHILGTLTPGLVFASEPAYAKAIAATVVPDVEVVLARGGVEGRAVTPSPTCWPRRPAPRSRPRMPASRRHHRQVPVHLGLDQAAQGRDQHAPHVVRQPADDAPVDACSWPRSRRCWSTGCRGTTPSAATTTSASRCTTAARSTSTTASRRRPASPRRCATCARSRPRSTSTCPRASRRSRARWTATSSCATPSSRLKAMFFAGAGLSQAVWDQLDATPRPPSASASA